jgi:hypothetical protein
MTVQHTLLPPKEFEYFQHVWKVDDCNPEDWKDYIVLGVNWACSRLANGIPNDGYWEYELSKPTGIVWRVQLAEDWLMNDEQWEKEKTRWLSEQEEIDLVQAMSA